MKIEIPPPEGTSMSHGPGRLQRQVLAALAEHRTPMETMPLCRAIYGEHGREYVERRAIQRALTSLQRHGLVRVTSARQRTGLPAQRWAITKAGRAVLAGGQVKH